MNIKFPTLFRTYHLALRRYLEEAPPSDLGEARKLGDRALETGLETLDMARMHEEALIALVLKDESAMNKDEVIRLAGTFFAEVIIPIESTHRAAREASAELAATNEEMKKEIRRREKTERSLILSEETTSELLKTSLQMQEDLRFLSRRLLTAQEEERKRISRELHDVVAQALAAINVRLAALTLQNAANSSDIHEKIEFTQHLVEQSVDIVHRFARDLRPTVLDDLGLIPALEAYLKDFAGGYGIGTSFSGHAGVEKLSNEERTVLYRVAQEALVNVAGHSKAKEVKLTIIRLNGLVRMEVEDNGEGFDVERSRMSQNGERLGLLGMRERVEMVGGKFQVESGIGQGTIIRADIPVETPKRTKKTTRRPATSKKRRP